MGKKLSFYLSLGLFSSFGVDAGTRLLMKTIAKQDIIPKNGSVLDSGCGTGTIALSIKKRFPELDVTATDRDALAMRFSGMNAELNKISSNGFNITGGLLPGSLKMPLVSGPQTFDLIISNIPAKAGNPVIKDFLQNCGLHLKKNGRAAIVIVEPLASFAGECLEEGGAEITYSEADKQYTVFHFIPGTKSAERSFSDIYLRTDKPVSGFYGLPDFDSISYCTRVTIEMLKKFRPSGKTLIWNPGIGHIPLECGNSSELLLAGADLLQLKASEYNLATECRSLHLPVFSDLEKHISDKIDYIAATPLFISGAGIENEIIDTSLKILGEKGKLLISGKSSDIARIEKIKKGFSIKNSIKYRGFRALLLEKW